MDEGPTRSTAGNWISHAVESEVEREMRATWVLGCGFSGDDRIMEVK